MTVAVQYLNVTIFSAKISEIKKIFAVFDHYLSTLKRSKILIFDLDLWSS